MFSAYGFTVQLRDEISSCALHYKCFTILMHDHNDSGQYYKTSIVIKASLS